MRTRAEVSHEKLRGGYYTPGALVDLCFERADALLDGESAGSMLEPAAGDGAFLRGLARTRNGLLGRVSSVRAIEIDRAAALEAELSLRASSLPGGVLCGSVLPWAADTEEWFGLVVGNPPFVRYQFVSQADRRAIARLGARLGLAFSGVSNLWIPVLLGALARLRRGGVLALVLPAECFTGSSAQVVREWLMREVGELRFDLFPAGSFPGVLQEVSVLSGRRGAAASARPGELRIVEHGRRAWSYRPGPGERSWTRSLLEPRHLQAAELACGLPGVERLGELARLEVGVVTGANDFFCVDEETLARHRLEPWARPLLARSRDSPGLVFGPGDHEATRAGGARAWLLGFDSKDPDPQGSAQAKAYLEAGMRRGLAERYKCRIREPWYRVPSLRTGSLMLSKRCHDYPRLLINRAAVLTTDTIYRGCMLPGAGLSAGDLVAAFHSSLTLLYAELEGRSFGGGVLELVPSEISRLVVLAAPGFGVQHLERLDLIARRGEPEELVRETDSLLAGSGLLAHDLIELLAEARLALMRRRHGRGLGVESRLSLSAAQAA